MKGKVLAAAGTLALLGVAALLSRRTNEPASFDLDDERGDPRLVSEDTLANLKATEEE